MNIDKLTLTLRDILRYGSAGLMLALISAVLVPSQTKSLVEILGPVLSPLVVVAVGALFYAMYRAAVNDLFVDPAVYWLHRLIEYMWRLISKRRDGGHTCVRHYLEETFSVHRRHSINALRVIRDSDLFPDNVRDRLHVQNSENHVVYMSGTMLLGSGILLRWTHLQTLFDPVSLSYSFILLGLLLFALGFQGSISACRQFCAQVGCLDRDKIKELLSKAQLSDRTHAG